MPGIRLGDTSVVMERNEQSGQIYLSFYYAKTEKTVILGVDANEILNAAKRVFNATTDCVIVVDKTKYVRLDDLIVIDDSLVSVFIEQQSIYSAYLYNFIEICLVNL